MSFLILLSSCASKPPNVPGCRRLAAKYEVVYDVFGIPTTNVYPNPVCMKEIKEIECGRCAWSLEKKEQYVGEAKETWLYGKPWSQLTHEAVIIPSEAYAKIKTYMINSCKEQNCDKVIAGWRIKLDAWDSAGNTNPKP